MDKNPARYSVERTVEIDTGVYEVYCDVCNSELDFSADCDLDADWTVNVMPCNECINERAQELMEDRLANES